mgnify:CR=1 FL=1
MENLPPESSYLSPPPKQILARHGKSFYWASLFLGGQLAERAAQLYQFCRFVDDIADGDLPHRHETLEDISQSLIHHQVSAGTEVQAFLQLANDIDIPNFLMPI